jgi:hypothetical protein
MNTSWSRHVLKSKFRPAARRIAVNVAAPLLRPTDTTDTDEASDAAGIFIDGAGI